MELKKITLNLARLFRCGMTLVSPKLNTLVCFRIKSGKWLNMKHPDTFREKLVVLKLVNYDYNPLVKKCADKYKVREYIQERLTKEDADNILNELIAVYDSPKDIVWDALPQQFAVKWNFGCGFNIIVQNKNEINISKVTEQLAKWQKNKWYLEYAEMQYKNVEKKIIIEKYLTGENGGLPEDYKLYCFNGKCHAILYISDRDKSEKKGGFFDTSWNYLGNPEPTVYNDFIFMPVRPKSLEKMIEVAEILSSDFPFVRVDFYDVCGSAIFGEMTFTPSGGAQASQIDVHGVSMGDLLKINC